MGKLWAKFVLLNGGVLCAGLCFVGALVGINMGPGTFGNSGYLLFQVGL